ncbi:capsular biosynthesis protein [Bacillus cereus]|nr:capsular biosynthesis protein [Bacillus cereus]
MNDTHKLGNRIIIFSYIVVIAISTFLPNRIFMGCVPLLFFITLYGFQSYMEWKYDKESREFLISLLGIVALIITGFILHFFL